MAKAKLKDTKKIDDDEVVLTPEDQQVESAKASASTKAEEQQMLDAVASGNSIEVLPVNPESFRIKHSIRYVPFHNEFDVLKSYYNAERGRDHPLLFVGPAGVGKTASIPAYNKEHDIGLMQFDCSEGTKRQDLMGRYIILDGEVKFSLGILPMSMVCANVQKEFTLVMEELNALLPAIQKSVNQFLDWRRHCFVPEIDRVYRVNPDSKLHVCATMNPSTYAGTHELTPDLEDRFTVIDVPYPTEDMEQDIIEHEGIDEQLFNGLLSVATETRAGYANNDLEVALSPRTLQKFCDVYRTYSANEELEGKALKLAAEHCLLSKYKVPSQKDSIRKRVYRTLGIQESD